MKKIELIRVFTLVLNAQCSSCVRMYTLQYSLLHRFLTVSVLLYTMMTCLIVRQTN
jgi:hypothetical protein